MIMTSSSKEQQHDSSLTLRSTNLTLLTTSGGSVASDLIVEKSYNNTPGMNNNNNIESSRLDHQDHATPDTGLMTNKIVTSKARSGGGGGHFTTINSFILYMCVVVMLTNALNVGYRNSVLTTIEKCYEFSSIISGILSGCLELGSLLATLIVSYFCAKSHIPRSIGLATLVCSLGSIIYSLPHFMSESYTNNNKVINKTTSDIMCKTTTTTTSRFNYSHKEEEWRNSPMSSGENMMSSAFGINPECLLKPSQYGHFVTMIVANVLLGISSAPLYTLGTAYIDNHVSQENSSVYLGFIYSMLAFGPLVGYLVGAAILQFYVDSFSVKDLKLNPGDSDWVGAWYVGFILFSILIFFNSFPFFCFPRNLKKEYDEPEATDGRLDGEESPQNVMQEQQQPTTDSSFGHFKDLPRAIWNLLKNRIFMIVTFAYCFEITIISGFITFLPKYIEHQFMLNNSLANIFTGSVAIPGAVAGILTGGYLVKKLKVNPRLASVMAISSNIVCLVGILGLIFVGCPNIPMAGTTIAYKTDFKDLLNKPRIEAITLNSECNSKCQCSLSSIEPICGRDGVSYFSPCYAGCTAYEKSALKTSGAATQTYYHSCKCIQQELKGAIGNYSFMMSEEVSVPPPDAQAGLCHPSCDKLLPFLLILFCITFLTALNQMPMLMVTLRSVSEIERAFALGIQLVFMRLLAYIPSPLIFGQAIDWTCLVWRKNECEQVGSCLLYDRERFRYIYGTIAAVYKCISLVLFALLFYSVRNTNYNHKPSSLTKEASSPPPVVVFKTSGVSLNLINNNDKKSSQE